MAVDGMVVMGYLPSRWDSGDEATGPQMDEIATVDTYRRLGSRVGRAAIWAPPAPVGAIPSTDTASASPLYGKDSGSRRRITSRTSCSGAVGRGLAETGRNTGSEMTNDAATAGD
jgi:hypothetical protein